MIKILLLALLLGNIDAHAQACYQYGSVPLIVLQNQCTNTWDLRAYPTDYGLNDYIYCQPSCYQYNLLKDGYNIQQAYVSSLPYTFHINYDQPGKYSINIFTKYEVPACGLPISQAVDLSNQVTLTNFCLPSTTLSNVNSQAGTLPLTSRTRDYIHTSNTVTVSASTNVAFYSQGEVSLSPGFSTESSSNFIADIATCGSTATSCSFRIADNDESQVKSLFTALTSLDVFPNPATNTAHLSTGNFSNTIGTIELFNLMGEKILTLEDNSSIKSYYDIDTQKLSGLYIVRLSSSNKTTSTIKFLVKN